MSWTLFFFSETFSLLLFFSFPFFLIFPFFFSCAFTNARKVEEEISAGVFIRGRVD